MSIVKVTTHQVNPRQSNLVVASDYHYRNYDVTDLGFTYQSRWYNQFKDIDPLIYQSTVYQLSPYLVSKLFLPSNKDTVAELLEIAESQPDTKQWLLESRDKLHTIKYIKEGDMSIVNAIIADFGLDPADFEPELKPHQLIALALYITLGYCFNFGEIRTGKTPPTIIYAYSCYMKKLMDNTDPEGVDFTLVACPNSIKYNWLSELGVFTNHAVEHLSTVIEGTKPQKIELWNSGSIFKIAGYSTFRADNEWVLESIKGKSYGLILDEIQRVKNDSQQTKAIKSLIDSDNPPRFVLGLTGTFVANKPVDVSRPCQMVVPYLLGKSHADFVDEFCYSNSSKYNEDTAYVTGYKKDSLETIRDYIARISIRARRADVGQIHGLQISPQLLDMAPQQAKLHKDVQELLRAELTIGDHSSRIYVSGFLPKLLKLTQIADGFVYINGEAIWLPNNPKLRWLDEFLKEYLWNIKKVVIYSRFKAVLFLLEDRYKEYGVASVHGGVKPEDRTRLVNQFRYEDNISIMLMNPDVAAGNDLNPAQWAIFYDRKYFLEPMLQAEGRITGFNQTGDSTIIPLVCRNSIDYPLEYEVLPQKRKHAAIVQGDEMPDELPEGSGSLTFEDLITLVG